MSGRFMIGDRVEFRPSPRPESGQQGVVIGVKASSRWPLDVHLDSGWDTVAEPREVRVLVPAIGPVVPAWVEP